MVSPFASLVLFEILEKFDSGKTPCIVAASLGWSCIPAKSVPSLNTFCVCHFCRWNDSWSSGWSWSPGFDMDNGFNKVPWNLGGNRSNCKIFQWNLSYVQGSPPPKKIRKKVSENQDRAKCAKCWIHRGGYRPPVVKTSCAGPKNFWLHLGKGMDSHGLRRMLQGEVDCSPDVCFGTVVLEGSRPKGNRWVWEGIQLIHCTSLFYHVFMMSHVYPVLELQVRESVFARRLANPWWFDGFEAFQVFESTKHCWTFGEVCRVAFWGMFLSSGFLVRFCTKNQDLKKI